MRSHQIAASLLAGCAVQAAADSPAAAVSLEKNRADELVSASAPTNDRKNGHRLLQKFKRRLNKSRTRERQLGEADLGVLASKRNAPRFLDEESGYDYYCPTETCPSELCECADSGGSLEDCTDELLAVCRAGRLGDCVFKDYVQVYEEVYCGFASCVGEGFRENQCDCAFYELYCQRLQGEECKEIVSVASGVSDGTDKKPFFGCDETELANVCDEATTCKKKGDLQGLPDLGTWKGSVTEGLPGKNSGGRMSPGGVVVGGVALLSMLWLMVNV